MAAAISAISCLFHAILVSSISAYSRDRPPRRQLQVLDDVVSGPARGRPLALHLDETLPADMQRAVLGVEAVRRTPHLTLSLGLNNSHWLWQEQEVAASILPLISSSYFLFHVVLWLTPRPELLQALWLQWKPRNLLFFSLGSYPGADVLGDEALSGVENLALIGQLSAEADPSRADLGLYSMLPFAGGVHLLGPWEYESFNSWAALFPDRFSSFEGYIFHLATYLNDPPFAYEYKSATGTLGRGSTLKTLDSISHTLNFTYTLTRTSPDLKWGVIENGSWVGLLGMMTRKEKNFTINPLYISKDRIGSFDPSEVIGRAQGSVFVLSPTPLPEWLSIIRPFSPSAWVSFVAVVVVAVFFMACMVSFVCI